jgi:GntR family transcriptional regulator/MocR family aminotransferase
MVARAIFAPDGTTIYPALMPKRSAGIMLAVTLDPSSRVPLYRQLCDQIRRDILAGQLRAGARLPSTRTLAGDLGISRTTVLTAFDQLVAEGCVHGRTGSGTRVTATLQDSGGRAPVRMPAGRPAVQIRRLSSRARSLERTALALPDSGALLRPGNPDLRAFPRELWSRLAARHWRQAPEELLGYGDPKGYLPLREAAADYVRKVRGVHCEPGQLLIVGGSQQALYLCGQVLLNARELAWLEDPGYPGARSALAAAGAQIVPIPVDGDGMIVSAGKRHRGRPKLVYVTPSHQCPLGSTMSLSRRLELLSFAHHTGAWIVEDDYDSEYRYFSRPVATLRSLDEDARVIYVGTVSKSLSPSLRVGYLIVPADLVDSFARARASVDRQPAGVEQAVLAEFVSQGHLERHIRQTRKLYLERQRILLQAIESELGHMLEAGRTDAGMYLVAWLKVGIPDITAAQAAARQGLGVMPLSAFCLRPLAKGGLVIGYGAFTGAEIREGVRRLAQALGPLH